MANFSSFAHGLNIGVPAPRSLSRGSLLSSVPCLWCPPVSGTHFSLSALTSLPCSTPVSWTPPPGCPTSQETCPATALPLMFPSLAFSPLPELEIWAWLYTLPFQYSRSYKILSSLRHTQIPPLLSISTAHTWSQYLWPCTWEAAAASRLSPAATLGLLGHLFPQSNQGCLSNHEYGPLPSVFSKKFMHGTRQSQCWAISHPWVSAWVTASYLSPSVSSLGKPFWTPPAGSAFPSTALWPLLSGLIKQAFAS